ncbi:MAG: hypothetical protein QXL15_04520, partial [Candidatus Korarchaeota archaeon]
MTTRRVNLIMLFLVASVIVVPVSADVSTFFSKFGHDISEESWYAVANIAEIVAPYYQNVMSEHG